MKTKRWHDNERRRRRQNRERRRRLVIPASEFDKSFGVKRHKWRTLKGFWRFHKLELPGTVEDFVKFCEAPSAAWLEKASVSELMCLPGVQKRHLIGLGGGFSYVKGYTYSWRVSKNGKAWTTKDGFHGSGRSVEHAALSGLIVWWELITYRLTQTTS